MHKGVNMQPMKLEQALQIIKESLANVNTTLQNHQILQQAISVVEAATKQDKKS